MKIKRLLTVAALAGLILTGCASTGGNPAWLPPPGSKVELLQEIPAGDKTKVYIQNGRVSGRSGVSVNTPYCFLTLDRVAPQPNDSFIVQPGVFEVVKSYRKRDMVSAEPVQYAGRAGSDRTMATIMELVPAAQPEVKSLTCARWGMMQEDGWPSIDEMKATLRPLIEISIGG